MSNRCICTKLNNCVSSLRNLLFGVPQGSILGPTLFLCYINNLTIVMRGFGTNISLYADDAVLYSSDSEYSCLKVHLETLLSVVINWSQHNCIDLNVQNTKFVYIWP